jgi:GNAT superfamily N-acetyltransferase
MISIIPFGQQFQDQLVSLILNIQQLEFSIPITEKEQPDLFMIDEFYRKSGGEFWVAVSEGEVVGSIALIKIGNNAGVIRKMFVQKEFRGKEWGTAQLLFDSMILHCQEKDIHAVYLGTIDRLQAAIRFYEKNGFSIVDKSTLPADFPIMPVDNVFCKLSISQD